MQKKLASQLPNFNKAVFALIGLSGCWQILKFLENHKKPKLLKIVKNPKILTFMQRSPNFS